MKKISLIFDKKVRIVAFLLSLTLIFDIFFYDYKKSFATGGVAVAAAASTAVPVVGPFIAVTLVACGVVGAVEWCRNHPDQVESVRKDLVKALNDVGEDFANGVKTGSAALEAGGEWIKTNIVDGKNYISSKILDTCLDVYSAHGLLDGVKTSIEEQKIIPVGNTFNVNTYDIYSYIDSLNLPSNLKKSLNSQVVKGIEQLGTPDVILNVQDGTSSGFWSLKCQMIKKSDVSNFIVKSVHEYSSDSPDLKYSCVQYNIRNDSYYSIPCVNFKINGLGVPTYSIDSLDHLDSLWRIRSGSFQYFKPVDNSELASDDLMVNPCSNIGSFLQSGIELSNRVARKNPTTGAWELPWDTGANVNVEGVGDSYPVSIPWENSYVWNPSKIDYPDIALPFPGELDIPYPDLPITGSQEIIQTGEIELPEPIPDEPEIQENDKSYILPKWIEDRFPFCIPKDLSSLASLFSSTSRHAPEWAAKLFYGDDKEFNLPINFKYVSSDGSVSFDRIAYICRLIQFILFLCGLMMVTRNLLRS